MSDEIYKSLIHHQLSAKDDCGYYHYKSYYYYNGVVHIHSDLTNNPYLSSDGSYTTVNKSGRRNLITRFGEYVE